MDESIGNMKTAGGAPVGLPKGPDDLSLGSAQTRPGAQAVRGGTAGRRFRMNDVILSRYRVTGELGQGGMGVVYRCFDEVGGIDVALKALPPEFSHDAGEMDEVRDNFRLIAKLVHQNIAGIKTLEKDPATGDVFLIMECVEGVNLRQWRKREEQGPSGGVALERVLPVVRQVAAALDFAHSQKIVHRDIKPANIMVRSDGVVKVLDFGLAAEIRSSLSRVSKEKGDTSGTRPYMAPEQWAGRKQDGRTDQYALAVLVYELVSGAVPFASAFATGDPLVMANVAKTERPESLAQLDEMQNQTLLRALSKDPGRRFVNCGQFVAVLGNVAVKRVSPPDAGVGKTVFWMAVILGLAVASVFSVRHYQAYTLRQDEERRVSAQADAARKLADDLDKAKRMRIGANLRKARDAFHRKDYAAASKAVSAVLVEENNHAAALELSREIGKASGLEGVVPVKAEAEQVFEEVMALDGGEGVEERQRGLFMNVAVAEEFYKKEVFDKALEAYRRVLTDAYELRESGRSRQAAKTQRETAEIAKKDAEANVAAIGMEHLNEPGERAFVRADSLFERGAFAEASKVWQQSAECYAIAKSRALAVRAYKQAKSEFKAKLQARNSEAGDLLEKHGGAKWAEVMRLQALGESAENDPVEGEKAYRAALAALSGAVEEARAAEQAALDAARQTQGQGGQNPEAQSLMQGAEKKPSPVPAITQRTAQTQQVTQEVSEIKPAALGTRTNEKATGMANLEDTGKAGTPMWKSPKTGMVFVWVPALKVWVGKYEVTNGEYRKKIPTHNSKNYGVYSLNRDRQPVVYVNFEDAKAYAVWLTKQDKKSLGGTRYRLISEKEWETVARCGDGRGYPWGNTMPPKWGNYSDSASPLDEKIGGYTDGHAVTCDVEMSGENQWGLFGVGGNVQECCASDVSGSSFGAWRGASWLYAAPKLLECAYRYELGESRRYYEFGFRLVLTRPPP